MEATGDVVMEATGDAASGGEATGGGDADAPTDATLPRSRIGVAAILASAAADNASATSVVPDFRKGEVVLYKVKSGKVVVEGTIDVVQKLHCWVNAGPNQ